MRVQMKPETIARRAAARKDQQATQRQNVVARLREKYNAEPNREYAEAVWGELLATVEG